MVRYATSRAPLLLKLRTESFMERGADLSWVSAFPDEVESLFPPLTYLKPTGKRQIVEIGQTRWTVVEVRPMMS